MARVRQNGESSFINSVISKNPRGHGFEKDPTRWHLLNIVWIEPPFGLVFRHEDRRRPRDGTRCCLHRVDCNSQPQNTMLTSAVSIVSCHPSSMTCLVTHRPCPDDSASTISYVWKPDPPSADSLSSQARATFHVQEPSRTSYVRKPNSASTISYVRKQDPPAPTESQPHPYPHKPCSEAI